tara:strand:+ start:6445 stop:7590 length:1146 start_codon:yes stop_codon:yes gene_type:complete
LQGHNNSLLFECKENLRQALANVNKAPMTDSRRNQLSLWTKGVLSRLLPKGQDAIALEMVSGDASFRRYFRVRAGNDSFVAVDAPPENEDGRTFEDISNLFRQAGVVVPKIYSADHERGFMLLSDLGDMLYHDVLREAQQFDQIEVADSLYQRAISSLLAFQTSIDKGTLDPYNRHELRKEMELFEEWFCGEFLSLPLNQDIRDLIDETFGFLEDAALGQPEVAVHRDYHSRNLMVLDPAIFGEEAGPGIIDFQDAVFGAYTYDLVSLLRDCYLNWSPKQVDKWATGYLEQAGERAIVHDVDQQQFFRDFDLMGLQRHLKVMGIFARLNIRDNKPCYLADIPQVIRYFLEVSQRYREISPFVDWFNKDLLPVARTKLNLDY